MRRAAVISLTERGRRLSEKISSSGVIGCERFCFEKHTDGNARSFGSLSALVSKIFGKFDAVIFVCACGIAVRTIAPHICSKTVDPAVIVIDDCGQYVIPVLSGHIGGANELAKSLAPVVGGVAAVTTATDSGGVFSPDLFAKANGLFITDMTAAKLIAAAVLDGEKIGLVSECSCVNSPECFTDGDARCGIYIGTEDVQPFEVTLRLIPRDLAVGIGCKRGTCAEKISSAVDSAGIDKRRIFSVASIDLKANESGLIGFSRELGVPFLTYTAEELRAAEGDFSSSEFVAQVTGVDNVCERSAVLSGGADGKLVIKKTVHDGVTVAAVLRRVVVDLLV